MGIIGVCYKACIRYDRVPFSVVYVVDFLKFCTEYEFQVDGRGLRFAFRNCRRWGSHCGLFLFVLCGQPQFLSHLSRFSVVACADSLIGSIDRDIYEYS